MRTKKFLAFLVAIVIGSVNVFATNYFVAIDEDGAELKKVDVLTVNKLVPSVDAGTPCFTIVFTDGSDFILRNADRYFLLFKTFGKQKKNHYLCNSLKNNDLLIN